MSPAEVERQLTSSEPVTGPTDPWLVFRSSEWTRTSLNLETVHSLSNAFVLVNAHSIERWYESPDGDENLDVPGRSSPNYLRIRADITLLSGELPLRNEDGSIFLDLLMPHTPTDRESLDLPPAPYLVFVTATELLDQEWDLLAAAAGRDAAAEFERVRGEGYIVTTRAGLIVSYKDGLRSPLLETDLLHSVPESFVAIAERGFMLEPSDAEGVVDPSLIPVVVSELEALGAAGLVEWSRGIPARTSADVKQSIDQYRDN